MDQKASLFQSVNTVKNGDSLEGYTTDPDGFLSALCQAGFPLKGRVVILGAGGVARTMAYEATMAGCFVVLAVRPKASATRPPFPEPFATTFTTATPKPAAWTAFPAISTC